HRDDHVLAPLDERLHDVLLQRVAAVAVVDLPEEDHVVVREVVRDPCGRPLPDVRLVDEAPRGAGRQAADGDQQRALQRFHGSRIIAGRMRITTWNVNSVRARLPRVLPWLERNRPDVVLLQETKVEDEAFPREPLEDAGYNIAICGQKTYNGVAVLCKHRIE